MESPPAPESPKKRKWWPWVVGLLVLIVITRDPPDEAAAPARAVPNLPLAEITASAIGANTASANLTSWRSQVELGLTRCSYGIASIGEVLKMYGTPGFDQVAAYRVAEMAEGACSQSHLSIDEIAVPDGLADAQQDRLDEAVGRCETASYMRKRVASSAMLILDGDTRPSVQSGLQQDIEGATLEGQACERLLQALAPA